MQPAILAAKALLGCVLVTRKQGLLTAAMIVETEAYLGTPYDGEPFHGAIDRAAHSARGLTPRTRVIFGPPGRAYVYFIYGMHECLNVVCEPEGIAGCVLIRAAEPLCGLAVMAERRGVLSARSRPQTLTNGPGKLTQALAITRADYGVRLDRGPLTIRGWRTKPSFDIETTPRIGITQSADWPLRFLWKGNSFVSR